MEATQLNLLDTLAAEEKALAVERVQSAEKHLTRTQEMEAQMEARLDRYEDCGGPVDAARDNYHHAVSLREEAERVLEKERRDLAKLS